MRPHSKLLVASSVALAACAEPVGPKLAASLIISPDPIVVLLDSSAHVSARLLDDGGQPLDHPPITWLILDTLTARLMDSTVHGDDVGATELIAATDTFATRVPVHVAVVMSDLAPGSLNSCVLSTDHRPLCWGVQLGTPRLLATSQRFARIFAGYAHACGLTTLGAAWCWSSWQGAVGDGTDSIRPAPVPVAGGHMFVDLGLSNGFTCGLTAAGEILCWGYTHSYVSGQEDQTLLTPAPVAPGLTFRALAVGYKHVCGVAAAGQTYCWGNNRYGQAGDSVYTACYSKGPCADHPVQVRAAPALVSISAGAYHTCGLTSQGEAWCWGDGENGELGDSLGSGCYFSRQSPGSSYPCSEAPVRVNGNHRFVSITAGDFHNCGLEADGSVWCWGYNYDGAFGDGTTNGGFRLTAGASGMRFASLRAGPEITCGIAVDRRAYCWGDDWFNALGNGPTRNDDRLVPAAILYQP